MSQIPLECVEWEVVDRLRAILHETTQDKELGVTHAFAVFSAICFWVRQRVPRHVDQYQPATWPPEMTNLRANISRPPWGLPEGALRKAGTGDPTDCIAWDFVRVIRDNAGHGITLPINAGGAAKGEQQLSGFRISANGYEVDLSGDQMRHLGTTLARLFCEAFPKPAAAKNSGASI